MPTYWGEQIFSLGSFPKVGQKQKTEEKEKEKRLNDGNKNGQLRIANAAWAKSKISFFEISKTSNLKKVIYAELCKRSCLILQDYTWGDN